MRVARFLPEPPPASRLDAAAVQLGKQLYHRQSKTGAFEFAGESAVDLGERLIAEIEADELRLRQSRLLVDQGQQARSGGLDMVHRLALALHRGMQGRGMIIGDETGIGKGRQLAGVAVFANKQNYAK